MSREGTPGFNPPGGFAAYAHQKSPPPEPEIYDVSMTSDMPSPQKDEPPPPVLESDAEDSPGDPKKNKGRFGGKLIRRLVGKKGKKDETGDSQTKRRKRRNSSASDGDDEYEVCSAPTADGLCWLHHYGFSLPPSFHAPANPDGTTRVQRELPRTAPSGQQVPGGTKNIHQAILRSISGCYWLIALLGVLDNPLERRCRKSGGIFWR